jgi:hypothetical protein
MTYQIKIRNFCHCSIDPRHVEAWMRSKFGLLDHLSHGEFVTAIIEAEVLVIEDPALAEQLAKSYGL